MQTTMNHRRAARVSRGLSERSPLALLCLLALPACEQAPETPVFDLRGSASDAAGGGSTDLTGSPDASTKPGELTLASCTTNIDPAAPAFYKTYFKCVTITMVGSSVVIATSSLPPHRSYYYGVGNPNYTPFDTRGGVYHSVPNVIKAQATRMTIPAQPVSRNLTITAALVDQTSGTSVNEYSLGPVGTAIDSVHIFNDLAAPGMTLDGEKFTFDTYNGHPTPTSDYHYHTSMPGPLEVLQSKGLATSNVPGQAEVELFGIMCDGTVVFGCTELDGSAPQGTLDAQRGHSHDLKDKAGVTHFTGRYHTHICPTQAGTFPYTPEIQFYTTCQRN